MAGTKKKSSRQKKKQKQFTFTVTRSGIVTMSLFLLLAIVWSFILGILVGRGYTPETVLPEVAGVASGPEGNSGKAGAERSEPNVLKPEELGFFESLQQEPQQAARESGSTPARSDEPGEREGGETGQSSGSAREFAYVYQVGSFKSDAKADKLKRKLAETGMSARVESVRIDRERWYRIYVLFKGTAEEAETMRSKLVSLGLNNFFLRSKQAM
jgi:cell division septation protein DedD